MFRSVASEPTGSLVLVFACVSIAISMVTASGMRSPSRSFSLSRLRASEDARVELGSISPPYWGGNPVYSVRVNMTYPVKRGLYGWEFQYYYNARLPTTGSRYEIFPPQYDEMCRGLPYDGSHQCNVIYATDGWSYIQFPSVGYCCKCENQFGSTRYDWLQEGATFVGEKQIRGYDSYGWVKTSVSDNYYWSSIDKSLPVMYNETWQGVPKQWLFDLDTYSTAPFDDSLVEAPSKCSTLCDAFQCRYYRKV